MAKQQSEYYTDEDAMTKTLFSMSNEYKHSSEAYCRLIANRILAALRRRGWTPPKKGKGKK